MSTHPEPSDLVEFRKANLDQVRVFYRAAALTEALAPLAAMTPRERDWVLRHHTTADVEGEGELYLRQALDELLHMCGVLNAGWCAGVLSEEGWPRIPRDDLLTLLELEEVRTYFGERYPLLHMKPFLQRLGGNLQRSLLFEPSWFAALLRLDASFRDGRLDDFLLVVDGYWLDSNNVHFGTLKDAVQDGQQIIEAVTNPWDERTCLQGVIGGLERFMIFCDDLQDLLDAASGKADLQEAAFLLYRYWFTVRGEVLNDIMDRTLLTLTHLDSDDLVDRGAIQHSVSRLFQHALGDTARVQWDASPPMASM